MIRNNITFSKSVLISNGLDVVFHFENENEKVKWIGNEFPKLSNEYIDDLEYHSFDIDVLKIGDECHVIGKGDQIFKITELIKEYDNHYSFLFKDGIALPISHCYHINTKCEYMNIGRTSEDIES